MQLDQQSAVILSFPQMPATRTNAKASAARVDGGRRTNLAFMLVVLALAALWLVFPPAQLTTSQTTLAQDLPAQNVLR
jgi:hypothetical protein